MNGDAVANVGVQIVFERPQHFYAGPIVRVRQVLVLKDYSFGWVFKLGHLLHDFIIISLGINQQNIKRIQPVFFDQGLQRDALD